MTQPGFEPEWTAIVCGCLDLMFEAADVGFVRNQPAEPVKGEVSTMLWEADPLQFAERYPDSGIVESYGDQWPAPCIDYWIYVDAESRTARLSTEGWSVDPEEVPLSGNGAQDAQRLRDILAGVLKVDERA